jgi:hypothetical protein
MRITSAPRTPTLPIPSMPAALSIPRTGRAPGRAGSAVPMLLAGILLVTGMSLTGCARVHQKDREFLSDPILQLTPDPQGAGLESHNLPRREGSSGGSSGSGGGCGC